MTRSNSTDLDSLFGAPTPTLMRPRDAVQAHEGYVPVRLESCVVFLSRHALDAFVRDGKAAGQRQRPIEASFLCLGRRAEDGNGPYVIIEELPLLAHGDTATVPVPVDARERVRGLHPALDIVGWAHTHPGYGIFFSGPDLETCRDYGADAVNLVYDPVNSKLGVALGPKMLKTFDLDELIKEGGTPVSDERPSDEPSTSHRSFVPGRRRVAHSPGKTRRRYGVEMAFVVLVLHALVLTGLLISHCHEAATLERTPAPSECTYCTPLGEIEKPWVRGHASDDASKLSDPVRQPGELHVEPAGPPGASVNGKTIEERLDVQNADDPMPRLQGQ